MDNFKNRTQITMSIVTERSQANYAGNIHGGEIMKLMDSAAGAVAYKYARTNVVTARVDELQFHLPIYIGALVTCTATVAYVGSSSMEVIVTVDTEDLRSDNPPQRALSAYFTMVSLDENGIPSKLPDLKINTEEERTLYEEGKKRHEEHRKARIKLKNFKV
ncbi:acyl-CoA thioesterase [Dehalobacterium formicoaceticum]|uniref:Acyl-CoA thioesterase n=1 Tax=Dehalobacterium formicoaceticum TaxID=51515 RepID=A0ABT1Y1U4_9FIRM|nr:acyl-CoA thioesterase [Dehalobacterium formicoaceticum]MCR6544837.1 acyl-CoA thioesterase [Dehalobacterium formicoaceticum]